MSSQLLPTILALHKHEQELCRLLHLAASLPLVCTPSHSLHSLSNLHRHMCLSALCKILGLVDTYNVQVKGQIYFRSHCKHSNPPIIHQTEIESSGSLPVVLHLVEDISDFVELFQLPIALEKSSVWHNIWLQSCSLQFFKNVHCILHAALPATLAKTQDLFLPRLQLRIGLAPRLRVQALSKVQDFGFIVFFWVFLYLQHGNPLH